MAAIWHQTYYLFGQGLVISALLAALPIFTLLFLLGVLRKAAWVAGISGLAVALAFAIIAYGMPRQTAVSVAVYGGLRFISHIVDYFLGHCAFPGHQWRLANLRLFAPQLGASLPIRGSKPCWLHFPSERFWKVAPASELRSQSRRRC
jgi:L-lactate permease